MNIVRIGDGRGDMRFCVENSWVWAWCRRGVWVKQLGQPEAENPAKLRKTAPLWSDHLFLKIRCGKWQFLTPNGVCSVGIPTICADLPVGAYDAVSFGGRANTEAHTQTQSLAHERSYYGNQSQSGTRTRYR